MLEHDEYWNWSVKSGDKVRCEVTKDGKGFTPPYGGWQVIPLIEGEEYEVVIPQGTPSGICVKNNKNQQIWGEHNWFTKIKNDESRNTI